MNSQRSVILIRGGGDLATGVAYRLKKAGFPIVVLELPNPMVVRRPVALASAVWEKEIRIEDVTGRLVSSFAEALNLALGGIIPVLVAPKLRDIGLEGKNAGSVAVLVDARMVKRNIDTHIDQAPLVVALGPGFTAGFDCHAVIETMRGHRLGRVIWHGSALPNTGTPGLVAEKGVERVLRAPTTGTVIWKMDIGQLVATGELIGTVDDLPVVAPFDGIIRGLIAPKTMVQAGLKIGDVDARADPSACFTISDKALAVGGGVLEAVLTQPKPVGASELPFYVPNRPEFLPSLSLRSALQLTRSKELVAFVGGGGKTSLMFNLAKVLHGSVVTTTTTRIFAAQMGLAPAVVDIGQEVPHIAPSAQPANLSGKVDEQLAEMGRQLARFGSCLVIGNVSGDKAAGVLPDLPVRLLARSDVDFVLVEADGSRMKPCKAPGDHEPVIPQGTTLVVPVVGIDALANSLDKVAHRPELVSAITGKNQVDKMTPVDLATLITHPEGGLKRVPEEARVIPFINKVENEEQLGAARQIASHILRNRRVAQVVIGAVRTARPVREIHRRVMASVLAAGRSERMGQAKQLLPWGSTTVLGQTLQNLKASAVHDLLLISGDEVQAVEAIATKYDVDTIYNAQFATGELLSSLKVAVRQLKTDWAAVMVVLADQPMIGPEIVDQLLVAYWQGRGGIIAPAYRGQRGNPVLIDRRFFAELLALPHGSAPRELLKRYPGALYLVEVDSESVLRDLDLPEDYQRWRP